MPEVKFSEEQQALVDKLVGDARVKSREKAQAEYEAQTADSQTAADQQSMVDKQEWQKLAETHKARVAELEPLEARVKGYEASIKEVLNETVQTLGDNAKTAVSGLPRSMSAVEKLVWLTKNKGLFQAAGSIAGDGVGTTVRPAKAASNSKPEPRRITSL